MNSQLKAQAKDDQQTLALHKLSQKLAKRRWWKENVTNLPSDQEMELLERQWGRAVADVYTDNIRIIAGDSHKCTYAKRGTKKPLVDKTIYNCRIPLEKVGDDGEVIKYITDFWSEKFAPEIEYSCKIQICYGGLINKWLVDQYKITYFDPRDTTKAFSSPVLIEPSKISQSGSILREHLAKGVPPSQIVHAVREETKSKPLFCTNVHFIVTQGTAPIMGSGGDLPEQIKRKNCVIDCGSEQDELCFFRAIAFKMLGGKSKSQLRKIKTCEKAMELADQVYTFCQIQGVDCKTPSEMKVEGLEGDMLFGACQQTESKREKQSFLWEGRKNICIFECALEMNIQVYTLDPDNNFEDIERRTGGHGTFLLNPLNISRYDYPDSVYLLAGTDGHIYLLTDPHKLTGGLVCPSCERIFARTDLAKRHSMRSLNKNFTEHRLTCTKSQKFHYPGGCVHPTKTVFDQCAELGVKILSCDTKQDDFAVFDIEAKSKEKVKKTNKTEILAEHEIISCSICSSVNGFTQPFHVQNETDPEAVVKESFSYLHKIQKASAQDWHEKMEPYYLELQKKIIGMGGVPFVHKKQRRGLYALPHDLITKLKENIEASDATLNSQFFNAYQAEVYISESPNLTPNVLPLSPEEQEEAEVMANIRVQALGTSARSKHNPDNDFHPHWESMVPEHLWFDQVSEDQREMFKRTKMEDIMPQLFGDDSESEAEANDNDSVEALLDGGGRGDGLPDNGEGVAEMVTEARAGDAQGQSKGKQKRKKKDSEKKLTTHRLQAIKECNRVLSRLRTYGSKLTVLGFNSGSYDMNVMLPYFPHFLDSDETDEATVSHLFEGEERDLLLKKIRRKYGRERANKNPVSVIKKGSSYLSVSTQKLHFLDLMNYMGPGVSYAKFLNIMNVSEGKGFFPYDILAREGVLSEHKMPEYDDYDSSLKGNILEAEEWLPFVRGHFQGKYMPLLRIIREKLGERILSTAVEQGAKFTKQNWLYAREHCIRQTYLDDVSDMQSFIRTNTSLQFKGHCRNVDCSKQGQGQCLYPESGWCKQCIGQLYCTNPTCKGPEKYPNSFRSMYLCPKKLLCTLCMHDELMANIKWENIYPECSLSRDDTFTLQSDWVYKNRDDMTLVSNGALYRNETKNVIDWEDPRTPRCNLKWSRKQNTGVDYYTQQAKLWKDQGFENVGQYLKHYNNLDVGPFVQGVITLKKLYRKDNIEAFKGNVSLPNVARQILHQKAWDNEAYFWLASGPEEGKLERALRNSCIGGPSIVFKRELSASLSTMRRGKGKPCRKILGYDANALYLSGFNQLMPSGPMVLYERNQEGKWSAFPKVKTQNQFAWLRLMQTMVDVDVQKEKVRYDRESMDYGRSGKIETERNGTMPKVANFRPDGIRWRRNFTDAELDKYPDSVRGIIYEFQGCHVHGHKTINDKCKHDRQEPEKSKALHGKTLAREIALTKLGFVVQKIYSCQWDYLVNKKLGLAWDCTREDFGPFYVQVKSKQSEKQAKLDQFDDSSKFEDLVMHTFTDCTFCEVDIQVPDGHESKFTEFSPIFCRGTVPGDMIDQPPSDDDKNTLLIGGLAATKLTVSTQLLRLYFELGLKVTFVHRIFEFKGSHCFAGFVQEVCKQRQAGDKPHCTKEEKLAATWAKLKGNSGYGGMLMCKDRHEQASFVNSKWEHNLKWQEPLWQSSDIITDNMAEVKMKKCKITQDVPIQIGKMILDYAKFRMLEFYYKFLDRYLSRKDFEVVQMDTDSLYFGISIESVDENGLDNSLEMCVKDTMLHEFDREKAKWLVMCKCGDSPCESGSCDKRTPGLFKKENEGHFAVALCSKTYAVQAGDLYAPSLSKYSSKGVPKQNLGTAPIDKMATVLKTGQPFATDFNSISMDKQSQRVVSIKKTRTGLTSRYRKRMLEEDGVHTLPLAVTLYGGCTPESACSKRRRLNEGTEKQRKLRKRSNSDLYSYNMSPKPVFDLDSETSDEELDFVQNSVSF